eukprot:TRINITY_DN29296_c0_g1_i7.p1 TRINITY_DN29296_c0_g1~~TRINITY_DN29296_c0_g1_i7.p1  ORF type:complete len:233 (-),score=-13.59 TRINITY_DN29296_c0_g1_i7:173-871(-)
MCRIFQNVTSQTLLRLIKRLQTLENGFKKIFKRSPHLRVFLMFQYQPFVCFQIKKNCIQQLLTSSQKLPSFQTNLTTFKTRLLFKSEWGCLIKLKVLIKPTQKWVQTTATTFLVAFYKQNDTVLRTSRTHQQYIKQKGIVSIIIPNIPQSRSLFSIISSQFHPMPFISSSSSTRTRATESSTSTICSILTIKLNFCQSTTSISASLSILCTPHTLTIRGTKNGDKTVWTINS